MSEPQPQSINEFIRAGAGAGKTHGLTRKVIEVALDHKKETGQWPRTVMTTFTRKATQELKERLLVYCLEEKREALEFTKSTSFLTITTMHGLFNLFLSRYGQPLGLPNQFKVVDSLTADFWRKQTLKEMISAFPSGHILNAFNFSQLLAHLKLYEKAYWTGTAQPIRSTQDFEDLYQILNEEMSENLQEIMEKARAETSGPGWEIYLEQLEGVNKLLQSGVPWEELRGQVYEAFGASKKPVKSSKNTPWSKETDKDFKKFKDILKKWYGSEEYSSTQWERSIEFYKVFNEFGKEFIAALMDKKVKESSLEANDLEFFSFKALKEKPELIEKFAQEIDSWFIDEFQDTSPLQLEILEAMMGQTSQYMVGDPQQSIYLFRGSRSEVFFNKKQKVENEGGQFDFRKLNRRSQENLLSFFNDFFPSVSEAFSAMEAHREPLEGEASVVVRVDTGDEKESNGEIRNLCFQINELFEKGVSPKDIGVLTRTKKELEQLQKYLMAHGFPVISHASSNFYQRREILDALSLLKFLINPWDDKNLLILLRSPWLAMSDAEIVDVIGAKKANFWENFKEYFKTQSLEHPGHWLLKARWAIHEAGVAWVFRQSLIDLGVIDYSSKLDPTGRREANLWKLINIIEKKAREPGASLIQFINEGFRSTQLEDLGDASDAHSPVEPNKINLMTVHSSKGLQFDYVFLPFLHSRPNETTFSHFNYWEAKNQWSFRLPILNQNEFLGDILEFHNIVEMKKREQEESLRVLYVAMTRAREKLFLSFKEKVKAKSWGELLTHQQDLLAQKDYMDWQDIEGVEEVFYQSESTDEKVRQPWDKSVSRKSQKNLQESRSTSRRPPDNWEQLQQDQKRRRQGVVLHKIFESLKTFEPKVVIELGESWLPEKKQDLASAIEFVLSQKEVPFKEIISKGHVEWGYQWEKNGEMEEKRIDLWGIAQDTLWVVDYKTGDSRYKDEAFKQIAEYSQALHKYLNWQGPTKWVAAYPFDEKIFVQDAP